MQRIKLSDLNFDLDQEIFKKQKKTIEHPTAIKGAMDPPPAAARADIQKFNMDKYSFQKFYY